MTRAKINFLLKQYLDRHHLSLVECHDLKKALETADQEMLSVLFMLLTKPVTKKAREDAPD